MWLQISFQDFLLPQFVDQSMCFHSFSNNKIVIHNQVNLVFQKSKELEYLSRHWEQLYGKSHDKEQITSEEAKKIYLFSQNQSNFDGTYNQFQSLSKMFENHDSPKKIQSSISPNLDQSSEDLLEEMEAEKDSIKDGLWSQLEIFKFISYLIYNRQGLKLKLQRRTSKVFKQMSVFIGTRSSVQCRSQNQRLFRKYKNIRNIVNSFKEQYGKDRFQFEYNEIILNPSIKFKTQYENYLQQQNKKSFDISTQTQPQYLLEVRQQYSPLSTLTGLEFYQHQIPFMANWIFLPYCS